MQKIVSKGKFKTTITRRNPMNITNEVYTSCPKCQTEAHGIDEINKIFGYYIEKDEMKPFQYCRSCRKWMEEEKIKMKNPKRNRHHNQQKDTEWATAASWGRQIHISRSMFESYLEELDYLVCRNEDDTKRVLEITDSGKEHSAVTNHPFHRAVLWDYDTFMQVVDLRAGKAKVHFKCSKCGRNMEEDSGFTPIQKKYICRGCGSVAYSCDIEVEFDK